MRSRREILFRLQQEAGNLRLWAAPPECRGDQNAPLERLPDPQQVAEALRGTPYAAEVERLADKILAHRFPLLGTEIDTGPEIDWCRDYVHGIATKPRYFRRIPYLDFARAGDHKVVWELNRHQHCVLLAQAFLLTGRQEFLREIAAQFDSWTRQNPFLRGINWTSALEVAFRALSWTWTFHLTGARFDAELRRRMLGSLYRHGLYLQRNLSIYFSPNTHLLGEAVALHALGALFPSFPRARRWKTTGARIVREQAAAQVQADGSHFEQSSYYHVYALDMFLFHAVLEPGFRARLAEMADYLQALHGPARRLASLGDDDGGRMFHPYGPRDRFGRATLATCAALLGCSRWAADAADYAEQGAWWLGPRAARSSNGSSPSSKLHPASGVAVLAANGVHLLVDAGPFGPGSGGHSHSDTLSITARFGEEDILIDPGTYTYVGDPGWRERFRGSAAHNTLRIGGAEQATPAGPFRWLDKPRVEVREWVTNESCDFLDAACSYRGFTHRRRVFFRKPDLVFILDDIDGPRGEHLLEQFWHLGRAARPCAGGSVFQAGSRTLLCLSATGELAEGGDYGWRSEAFGVKAPAAVVRAAETAPLPHQYAAMLDFGAAAATSRLRLTGSTVLHFTAGRLRFPDCGLPELLLAP